MCLDANFRLRNNLVSNYSTDPGLGPGMAYMVPNEPYNDYVLSQVDEEDVSRLYPISLYDSDLLADQHLCRLSGSS